MTVICINLSGTCAPLPRITTRLAGHHLAEVRSVPELLLLVRRGACDAALIACTEPTDRSDDILLEIRRADPGVPVLLACQTATTGDIIRMVRLGAFHVWTGEPASDAFTATIESALDWRRQFRACAKADNEEPWRSLLIGRSEPVSRMVDIIRLVAARRSSVLITGETGTGKEVVARAIHMAGGRSELPFVAVNCSAIPENLIESELFGYAKGAFTGAAQSHAGRFEQANGGTILLDEIGDLPMEIQVKLLRVLQERELQRLGGSETVRLNVRFLAATHVDLSRAVAEKTFREDLYYRLNVVPIHVPPLRERRSDIPLLVAHFLDRYCAAEGLSRKRVPPQVMEALMRHPWPGNIRQLEHAVETAVVLSGDRETLDFPEFRFLPCGAEPSHEPAVPLVLPDDGIDYEQTLRHIEWSLIQQALARSRGNKARAAELLRMNRTTLLARVRSLETHRQQLSIAACG